MGRLSATGQAKVGVTIKTKQNKKFLYDGYAGAGKIFRNAGKSVLLNNPR